MRSLAFKLTVGFVLVGLIGAGLVALFVRRATIRAFDRMVVVRAQIDFYDHVTDLYERFGNWREVVQTLIQRRQNPPVDPLTGEPRPPPRTFPLANQEGRVLIPGGRYRRGETVDRNDLDRGIPVVVEGQVVGWVLDAPPRPALVPRERQFLTALNQLTVRAALIAAGIALLVGILLASTLTHPLRELTSALRAMTHGELQQEVPVRSGDELGALATAFNKMSADLSRANQARRQMTADVAHDLRTPLTVLAGYIEALRDGVLPPSRERFDTMYAEAQHLQHLVDDLRTLSLADAGELPLNRQPTSPGELLERIAATHLHQAEQGGIELLVQPEDKLPDIDVDPERMSQVLGNLISNALRYTPPGGHILLSARALAARERPPRPRRRVADGSTEPANVSAGAPGGSFGSGPSVGHGVELEVRDSGQGIDPSVLPHIFDRSYRGDAARQQQNGESGLGLAIARSIVEAHGGKMGVESELGRGTVFTMILPVSGSAGNSGMEEMGNEGCPRRPDFPLS